VQARHVHKAVDDSPYLARINGCARQSTDSVPAAGDFVHSQSTGGPIGPQPVDDGDGVRESAGSRGVRRVKLLAILRIAHKPR